MPEPGASARILVALDALPRSAAALATAGALAVELDAELAGLFVEDDDLARLLTLPFARELCAWSGTLRPLALADVERVWRREAERLQRQLAEAAGQFRLRWSFRVARGRLAVEARLQAQGFDLVVLGARTADHVPAQGGPVLVLSGPEVPSVRLDLALRLARRSGVELVRLAPAGSAAGPSSSRERHVALARPDPDSLLRAVRQEGAGCLVLPEGLLQPGELKRVLDTVACPVVLVR